MAVTTDINSMKKEIKDRVELKHKSLKVRATMKPMHRTVDVHGVIIGCNDKYAHVLGYDKDEIIGMSIFDHTPSKHHDGLEVY